MGKDYHACGLRQDVNGVKGELSELRVELRTGLSEVRVEIGEARDNSTSSPSSPRPGLGR
jgi:hypothetical protein